MTKLAIKLHGDAKVAFGYNPPPEIMKMRQHFAQYIKDFSLSKIMGTLLQADLELKKSINTDKKLILLQCLIKIQTFL
jgi:DNA polymerase III delta subunit